MLIVFALLMTIDTYTHTHNIMQNSLQNMLDARNDLIFMFCSFKWSISVLLMTHTQPQTGWMQEKIQSLCFVRATFLCLLC